MALLLNIAMLLLCLTYPFRLQAPRHDEGRKPGARPEQAFIPLELNTSVANQRYCKNQEGGYDTLELDLRLHYKNIGQQPVILYKGSSIVYREMVSLNAQDAARRNYIFDLSLMAGVDGTFEVSDSIVPDKNFVVLSPGATFETMASAGGVLFLKGSNDEHSDDALSTGEYLLQVSVATFPYSQSLAGNLSNRWRSSGILWSSGLISTPMPFQVERDRKLVNCNP